MCKRRRRIPLNQPKIARFNGSKCVFSFIMSFFECFQRVDIGSLQFIYIVCVLIYFVFVQEWCFSFSFLSPDLSGVALVNPTSKIRSERLGTNPPSSVASLIVLFLTLLGLGILL